MFAPGVAKRAASLAQLRLLLREPLMPSASSQSGPYNGVCIIIYSEFCTCCADIDGIAAAAAAASWAEQCCKFAASSSTASKSAVCGSRETNIGLLNVI
jgi:hypothetical protein